MAVVRVYLPKYKYNYQIWENETKRIYFNTAITFDFDGFLQKCPNDVISQRKSNPPEK